MGLVGTQVRIARVRFYGDLLRHHVLQVHEHLFRRRLLLDGSGGVRRIVLRRGAVHIIGPVLPEAYHRGRERMPSEDVREPPGVLMQQAGRADGDENQRGVRVEQGSTGQHRDLHR